MATDNINGELEDVNSSSYTNGPPTNQQDTEQHNEEQTNVKDETTVPGKSKIDNNVTGQEDTEQHTKGTTNARGETTVPETIENSNIVAEQQDTEQHTEEGTANVREKTTPEKLNIDNIVTVAGSTDISISSGDSGVDEISHGEIFRFDMSNSIKLFHEDYDGLDESVPPIADPGVSPELADSPQPWSLIAEEYEYLHPSRFCENDYPLISRSPKKQKVLKRLQLEDDEGIVSTHVTIFPKKLNRKYSINLDINSENFYDMTSFPRGTLTILNMINFRKSSGMSENPRHGTNRDADGLCSLFLELGFIVERYDNPTKKIVQSALDVAASDGKSSCCACAILSHGEEGMVYTTDGPLNVREITKTFRRENLTEKPKLFLFQVCQSSDYMETSGEDVTDARPEKNDNVSLPCVTDFLYAYSTIPEYFSWRNARQGSWFIQALCSVFRENAHHMDLYRMLIRVNDLLLSKAQKLGTNDKETDDKRQIASIVSQMRKDLFLFPPYGPLSPIKKFDSYS